MQPKLRAMPGAVGCCSVYRESKIMYLWRPKPRCSLLWLAKPNVRIPKSTKLGHGQDVICVERKAVPHQLGELLSRASIPQQQRIHEARQKEISCHHVHVDSLHMLVQQL